MIEGVTIGAGAGGHPAPSAAVAARNSSTVSVQAGPLALIVSGRHPPRAPGAETGA